MYSVDYYTRPFLTIGIEGANLQPEEETCLNSNVTALWLRLGNSTHLKKCNCYNFTIKRCPRVRINTVIMWWWQQQSIKINTHRGWNQLVAWVWLYNTEGAAWRHIGTPSPTELTPWGTIFLEKLLVPQLLKNFPIFCGTQRFITVFTRTCQAQQIIPESFVLELYSWNSRTNC
jgi:hypothetical protein